MPEARVDEVEKTDHHYKRGFHTRAKRWSIRAQGLSTAYVSRQQKITGHLNKISNKSRRDQNKRQLRRERAMEK